MSSAMVALHKEQFGRGPTKAQSHMAGADALLCVPDDALLPAERDGRHGRTPARPRITHVSRSRPPSSSSAVERITGRTVRSFASATDPAQSTVIEAFIFEPEQ